MAVHPLTRLRGMARRLPDGTVMVFPRCRDVHTFTMKHPLDIAFVDRRGYVVEVHRFVLPGVRLRSGKACAVVERFARSGPWFMRGDVIDIPGQYGTRRIPRGVSVSATRKRRVSWS